MTPAEKAKELYDKFYKKCDDMYAPGYIEGDKRKAAKQCAIIAVKELITLDNEWLEDRGASNESIYWNEVKQEIEKL